MQVLIARSIAALEVLLRQGFGTAEDARPGVQGHFADLAALLIDHCFGGAATVPLYAYSTGRGQKPVDKRPMHLQSDCCTIRTARCKPYILCLM